MTYLPPKRRKLTKAEREEVYGKCNGHCAYCGTPITIGQMQVDHVIPMMQHDAYSVRGIEIDEMSNYLPACKSCNHYKSTLTVEKFRTAIERWPEVLMRDSVTYRNAVRFGMVEPKPHRVVFYFEKMQSENVQKGSNSYV